MTLMKRVLAALLLLIVFGALAGHLLVPVVVERALERWAATSGYDRIDIGALHVSPLRGTAALRDLRLVRDGEPALTVGHIEIDVVVRALLGGALRLERLELNRARLGVGVAADGVRVAGLKLGGADGGADGSLRVDRIRVSDVVVDFSTAGFAATVHVNALEIGEQRRIVADVIGIRDVKASVTRDASGSWRLSAGNGDAAAAGDGAISGGLAPLSTLSFKANRIEITGDSVIDYHDALFGVAVDDRLRIDEAYVTDIDTELAERPVTFLLREHDERGGGSVWRGEAFPFKRPLELSVKAELRGLETTLLARIAESAWGITLARGAVDAGVDLRVAQGTATGTLALRARDLETVAGGEPMLAVRAAVLEIPIEDLLAGELRLRRARLEGAWARVRHSEDGTTRVAGLLLPGAQAAATDAPERRPRFAIEDLHLLDGELQVEAPRFETTFRVNDAHLLDGRRVIADVISLADLNVAVSRQGLASWRLRANDRAFTGTLGEADAVEDVSAGSWLNALSLKVNRIEIVGESALIYEDNVIGTPIREKLSFEQAYLTDIDSEQPDRPARALVRERTERPERGGTSWEAELYLFRQPMALTLRAKLESVQLRLLADIARNAWGLDIATGSVDGELEASVVGRDVSGALTLRVANLETFDADARVLAVDHGELTISLAELARNELRVPSARFDGARMAVRVGADQAVRIAGLVLTTGAAKPSAAQQRYSVGDLRIVNSEVEVTTPALRLSFHVNELDFAEGQRLQADTISIRDLQLGIIRDGEQSWRLVGVGDGLDTTFGFGADAYSAEAQRANQPLERFLAGLSVRVARVQITGDSRLRLEDRHISVPYTRTARIAEAYLTDFDNNAADKPARFAIRLQTPEHTSTELEGSLALLAPNPRLSAQGTIRAFELPPLTALTSTELGFNIDTGQLDGGIEIEVAKGEIVGHIDLRLNLLAVSTTNRNKLRRFERRLHNSLSLRQIIRYLSDEQGVMSIRVPVGGDARAPTFGLDIDMDAAIRRALTDVVGLGVLVVAPALTAVVRGLRSKGGQFAPVRFEALSAALDAPAKRLLDETARRLTRQEALMVTLCGRVSSRDLQRSPGDAPPPGIELARARATAVKNYLVERHGIAASRLIACRPTIDPGGRVDRSQEDLSRARRAVPRVEIN